MTGSRVFITHAALDQVLAEKVVDCIRKGLNLSDEAIFCSSVDRHGIPTGAEFVRYIHDKLAGTQLVVPLVSPAYLDSLFCMWELGAAWIQQTAVHPLLVGSITDHDLPLLLKDRQARPISKVGLNELAARTADIVGVNLNKRGWAIQRDHLLQELDAAVAQCSLLWPATARAVERRHARVGGAAARIHQAHHSLRDVTHAIMQAQRDANAAEALERLMENQSFWDLLRVVAKEMAAAFTQTTGTACRVTIKQVAPPESLAGDGDGVSTRVRDFMRSESNLSNAHQFDRIVENTDFEAIYSGSVSFFVCNDIPKALREGTYKNSHVVADRDLPYTSTVVWPIRKILDGRSSGRQDLLGFLCVDAAAAGVFDDIDVQIGAAFADALYVLRPCILDR